MTTRDTPLAERANDGTPQYNDTVEESYRRLQYRTSIYAEIPKPGSGLRLGIYQAEAACGEGATDKNMRRLELAVGHAKRFDVGLLTFPELFVPGYTLDRYSARAVSEYKDGPSISRARQIARDNAMGLVVPYGEKVDGPGGRTSHFDSIAVIDEHGQLLDSYRKTHLYAQQERDDWDIGDSDFPVHRIQDFPVGILNCYECEFPELVRILALKGAKLIVGPTAADTYYRLPNGERSRVPYPTCRGCSSPPMRSPTTCSSLTAITAVTSPAAATPGTTGATASFTVPMATRWSPPVINRTPCWSPIACPRSTAGPTRSRVFIISRTVAPSFTNNWSRATPASSTLPIVTWTNRRICSKAGSATRVRRPARPSNNHLPA